MQKLINQIHRQLTKQGKTIAIAESCTGGLLSSLLTSLGGSSKFFILGAITYSNKAKTRILKIPSTLIKEKGAVSREVAIRMSQGIRKIAGSDLAISITGIAGPSGGSRRKPVGTVFISIDSRVKNLCKKFGFNGSRTIIRKKSALKALELLKKSLAG
jgi:nicotinamide-nucleotide amidase